VVITPVYAGLLALWFAVLSLRVIGQRRTGISLGDGGDPQMLRKIRAQANFAEYVPFILLLMAFLEMAGTSPVVLHGLGVATLVGRLLHGYALSFRERFPPGRVGGTALTIGVLMTSALLCLWQGASGLH
jgi:uncharacterized membrane protein YecN with MAPEG domain